MSIKMIHKGLVSLFAFFPLMVLLTLSAGCADERTSQQGEGVLLTIAGASIEVGADQSSNNALYNSSRTASNESNASTIGAVDAFASDPITKSTLRSASMLTTSDHIGVFLAGPNYVSKTNVDYKYVSATSWISTTPIYLYNSDASVCAYYPYSSSITDATAIPLTSQLYTDAADLYYCPNKTVSSTSQSTTFAMTHAYAKMTFKITRDASYNNTCNIKKIMIENAALHSTNTFNITNGTLGNTTADGLVSVTTDFSIASGVTASDVEILMVPATALSGNVVFSFEVDGEIIMTALPATGGNNLTSLTAANNYVISATIKGKSLEINHVNIADWWDMPVPTPVPATSGSLVESNCYMVQPGGTVYIPVSRVVAGQKVATANSSYTLPTTWTVGMLWTDNSNGLNTIGSVASIVAHVDGGYITVTAGSAEGNSVIAIYDGYTILWSWHIWTTDNPATEMVNGYVWMDRNLGATAVADGESVTFATCGGLIYQWGRKDPFPGSDGLTIDAATTHDIYNSDRVLLTSSNSTKPSNPASSYIGTTALCLYKMTSSDYVNQCTYSIKYPMLFLANWAGSTATTAANGTDATGGRSSWGGEYGENKSIFDPCPSGWRVPSGKVSSSTWSSPWSTWAYMPSITALYYNAYLWSSNSITALGLYRYPASGTIFPGNGTLSTVGSVGCYWSASPIYENAYLLQLSNSHVAASASTFRMFGNAVRCVQED